MEKSFVRLFTLIWKQKAVPSCGFTSTQKLNRPKKSDELLHKIWHVGGAVDFSLLMLSSDCGDSTTKGYFLQWIKILHIDRFQRFQHGTSLYAIYEFVLHGNISSDDQFHAEQRRATIPRANLPLVFKFCI